MNILITSIGSMSALAVIKALRLDSHCITGCDIHPGQWLSASRQVDHFYQAPLASDSKTYIAFINMLCQRQQIDFILPLTDIEVDILSACRETLINPESLCIMSPKKIMLCRDKLSWHKTLSCYDALKTISTCILPAFPVQDALFPLIVKPRKGRSSEGVKKIYNSDELVNIKRQLLGNHWIIQPCIPGNIYVVDIIRQESSGLCMAVARRELIRTANGAGISVEMIHDSDLLQQAILLAEYIGLNGCINAEFIGNHDGYFLMDINPRFSAGVEFSLLSGYDMITNHLRCFTHYPIDLVNHYHSAIFTRHYVVEQELTG